MKKQLLICTALGLGLAASASFGAPIDRTTVIKGTKGTDIRAPFVFDYSIPSIVEMCHWRQGATAPDVLYSKAFPVGQTAVCPASIYGAGSSTDTKTNDKYRTLLKTGQESCYDNRSGSAVLAGSVALCRTAYKGNKGIDYICGTGGACIRITSY